MKHRYLQALGIIIMVLALVRCIFVKEPEAPNPIAAQGTPSLTHVVMAMGNENDSTAPSEERIEVKPQVKAKPLKSALTLDYAVEFNDSNHVQLLAAQQWGVSPVKDRANAEQRKDELVYMACTPYYELARLDASIPYLVPHAAILLQDIGRAFLDSLQARQMPLYRIVVSSVLRSEADVARLRRSNKNATENSCHLYATTFDINYTVFKPVSSSREIDSDMEITLKRILGLVLYDLRSQGRCYVKYERIQPCFHITVR